MEAQPSIYAHLLYGTASVQVLAEGWKNSYGDNITQSRNAFYDLIAHCINVLFNNSVQNFSQSLRTDMDEENLVIHVPLLEKKDFHGRVEEFVSLCFNDGSNAVMKDETFWQNMSILLHQLITSREYARRWTAVTFCLTMMDSLIPFFRQNPDSSTEESDDGFTASIEEVKLNFNALSQNCFHFAYRDCEVNIQRKVASQLMNWISSYPETFTIVSYLRYVARMMAYPDRKVRRSCLMISKHISSLPRSEGIKNFLTVIIELLNSHLSASNCPKEACLATECLTDVNMKYPTLTPQISTKVIKDNVSHKNKDIAAASANFVIQDLRKTCLDSSLAIPLVELAKELLSDNPVTSYELSENVLIWVDAFFYDFRSQICNIKDFADIFASQNKLQSFKQFTSVFMKAVSRRAYINQPCLFRRSGKNAEDVESSDGAEAVVDTTGELLVALGRILLQVQDDEIILGNLLSICEYLYDDEDNPFCSEDLVSFINMIVEVFNNAGSDFQIRKSRVCVKALHTLRSKCVSGSSRRIVEETTSDLIQGLVDQFDWQVENLSVEIVQQGSTLYYQTLTAVLRKLTDLGHYFTIPESSFQGCECFIKYVEQALCAPSKVLTEITVWFEVIELSLKLINHHIQNILNKKTDKLQVENVHCIEVGVEYLPKFTLYNHATDPHVYFANAFLGCTQLLKWHVNKLLEIEGKMEQVNELISVRTQQKMERTLLHFVNKHMMPFVDDTTTAVMKALWSQFVDYLLHVELISFEVFFHLFKMLVKVAPNHDFQSSLLSFFCVLLHKKQQFSMNYLMKALLLSYKESTGVRDLRKLSIMFSNVAHELKPYDLSAVFLQFHLKGIKYSTHEGNNNPDFLLFLKTAVCLLSADGCKQVEEQLKRMRHKFPGRNVSEEFQSYEKAVKLWRTSLL